MSFVETEEERQDNLRVFRSFVGAIGGFLGDQSYAGVDGGAYNPSGQFSTIGPNGIAVEGQSVLRTTAAGGVVLSPALVLMAVGALAVLLLKRG